MAIICTRAQSARGQALVFSGPALLTPGLYSILLYRMNPPVPKPLSRPLRKQKVTFRVDPELAASLRQLPNQTAFVEDVLREALGRICPYCHGTGAAGGVHLEVSNLKGIRSGRLDRATAAELKALVRLGRQLLATELELESSGSHELGFRLAREDQLLLYGRIPRGKAGRTEIKLAH